MEKAKIWKNERQKDDDDDGHIKKKGNNKNKDRHRKGYYHDYNQAHPERLNRGFTKGYNNGNVSDGVKEKKRKWLNKTLGIYIIGYDEIGRPITNDPLGDMLRNKEMEWHDDDWCEDVNWVLIIKWQVYLVVSVKNKRICLFFLFQNCIKT